MNPKKPTTANIRQAAIKQRLRDFMRYDLAHVWPIMQIAADMHNPNFRKIAR